jgi:hypothetical protein
LCKPLLQGASRGLQFKGFITLPLLGCGSGLGMVSTDIENCTTSDTEK